MEEEKRQGFIDIHSYLKEKFSDLEVRVFPVLTDHSKRITALEKWLWRISGGVAVIWFLLSGFDTIINTVVKIAHAFSE